MREQVSVVMLLLCYVNETCIIVKLLCGLEASQGAVEEVLSSVDGVKADTMGNSDDLDPEEEGDNETKVGRKKKNKRRKGTFAVIFASSCMDGFIMHQSS